MPLTFRKLHPHFVAEVSPVDLRRVHDRETLDEIRAGMDEYAVLVFRDQPFTDAGAARVRAALRRRAAHQDRRRRARQEPLRQRGADRHLEPGRERARSCDPTTAAACTRSAIASGTPTRRSRTRRAATRCCRRASSRRWAPTRSSPTCARPTTRSTPQTKATLEGLRVHHSIAYSRQTLGFEFSAGGGRQAPGRRPSARAHEPAHAAPVALPRLACLAHHRLAGARRAPAAARPDRARDPAAVRLPPRAGAPATW